MDSFVAWGIPVQYIFYCGLELLLKVPLVSQDISDTLGSQLLLYKYRVYTRKKTIQYSCCFRKVSGNQSHRYIFSRFLSPNSVATFFAKSPFSPFRRACPAPRPPRTTRASGCPGRPGCPPGAPPGPWQSPPGPGARTGRSTTRR